MLWIVFAFCIIFAIVFFCGLMYSLDDGDDGGGTIVCTILVIMSLFCVVASAICA